MRALPIRFRVDLALFKTDPDGNSVFNCKNSLKKFFTFFIWQKFYTFEQAKAQLKSHQFNDGTEAFVNRPIAHDLFENDIVLTARQARKILRELKRCEFLNLLS